MARKHRGNPESHDVVYSIPLIEKDGRLCVVFGLKEKGRWSKPYWTLPGSGHVEEGETLKEALKRELKEELNVENASASGKPIGVFTDDGYEPAHTVHVYQVGLKETPETSEEIIETKTIELEKAREFIKNNTVSPTVGKALNLLKKVR